MRNKTQPHHGALKVIPLQSSSRGNSIYVESGGVGLLFDAGISSRKTTKRLDRFGIDAANIQGLFLSHEHHDHITGAGPIHRKYQFPLYATAETFEAAEEKLKSLHEIRFFRPAAAVRIGPITVHSINIPHDCRGGVCFVIEAEGKHFGILTDIGRPQENIIRTLLKLDAVLFESNYDEAMLAGSGYPAFLKRRISSGSGHLSNTQSASMLGRCGKKLKWVCLGHLSPESNSRQIAYSSASSSVPESTEVFVAGRTSAAGVFYL